jgi:hypothetical protein
VIGIPELREIARHRLRDARVLYRAGQYDAAAYICGYAVEVALKARICRTLRWDGFPEKNAEFDGLQSFRTHRLDKLLQLSGQQPRIAARYFAVWAEFDTWDPSDRYRPIGSVNSHDVLRRIDAAQHLVRAL